MTEVPRPLPPAEARNLMPRFALAAAIEKLNKSIVRAASNDEYAVRIDWLCEINGPTCSLTVLGKNVIEAFKSEGYTVRSIYEDRQFTDIGMALCWEPKKP